MIHNERIQTIHRIGNGDDFPCPTREITHHEPTARLRRAVDSKKRLYL